MQEHEMPPEMLRRKLADQQFRDFVRDGRTAMTTDFGPFGMLCLHLERPDQSIREVYLCMSDDPELLFWEKVARLWALAPRMLKLLMQAQWRGSAGECGPWCPWCGNPYEQGHAPECEVAAAINACEQTGQNEMEYRNEAEYRKVADTTRYYARKLFGLDKK